MSWSTLVFMLCKALKSKFYKFWAGVCLHPIEAQHTLLGLYPTLNFTKQIFLYHENILKHVFKNAQ